MKSLNRIAVTIVIVTLCLPNCVRAGEKHGSYDSGFNIPVFPTGGQVTHFSLQGGLIKGISYKAKVAYPADNILQFYEKELLNRGFKPFVEQHYQYADRKWSFFEDSTMLGTPDVAALTASWVNDDSNCRVMVILRYEWFRTDKSKEIILEHNEDLGVVAQILPFAEAAKPHSFPTKSK